MSHYSEELAIGRCLGVEYNPAGLRFVVDWAATGSAVNVFPGWTAGDVFELRQLWVRRTAGALVTTMQPEVWTVLAGGESSTDRIYQYGIATPTPQTDTRFPPDILNSGALPTRGGRVFRMPAGQLFLTPNAVLGGVGEIYNLTCVVARVRRA